MTNRPTARSVALRWAGSSSSPHPPEGSAEEPADTADWDGLGDHEGLSRMAPPAMSITAAGTEAA